MNWWLLSPEITLVAFAVIIIFLDLAIQRKGILAATSVIGLLVAMVFAVGLWDKTGVTALNGMLVIDRFSLFFQMFFPGVAALVVLGSTDYASRFSRFKGEYYALILLATTGMMFLASTGELISIYVSLELMSLSLYALTGFLRDPKSGEAGLKYLLLGAVASAVLLYGLALTFGITGTTHLAGIAAAVKGMGNAGENPALLMAIAFIIAGFGFKIASVPFQMWVPDVYEGAPTPITAFLSVASKAAGFAVLVRVFTVAFLSPGWLSQDWAMLFAVLSAVTMTLGNIVALMQTNIKRLLGYSSIAHAGYIMLGLAAIGSAGGGGLGQNGILFYLAAYGITNLGAFIAIIAVSHRLDSDLISDYAGMSQRSPLLAAALALGLISLTGLPVSAGFWAKIYIFNSAVQEGFLWLVVIALLNSVIAAYYYLRIVKAMYVEEPTSKESVASSTPVKVALVVCSIGVLYVGLLPGAVLRLIEAASILL
ncbi:MAG: NADH-quinone oxidoreductase subunit N [Dehalococcoidia bacterium]|jgi:NADH-quinone oxidoreductase subunit N|nr:NADH-quinone oxidoreductase subunit N [Dehalococcoidia bacterium]